MSTNIIDTHTRPIVRAFICFLIIFFVKTSIAASSKETVFTYRAAESDIDSRYDYDTSLLKLALENTIDTDGPFRLEPSPRMNFARACYYVEENLLTNFIIKHSYEPDYNDRNMSFVPFPVDLGIVGFRVCFAHPAVIKQLSTAETIDDLKCFTYGQGLGWTDVEILRHNGFDVATASHYESLFKMVANRRFDLFCRGANELLPEFTAHRHIENLAYDKSILINYPLPRFFYTHTANAAALDRVHRGLIKAYENGSLQELWNRHYQESIDFATLHQRKLFILDNPLVKDLTFDYAQFFFNLSE